LEDQGLDGMLVLKWMFKKYNGGVDWIDLDQDRDKWQTSVNTIMNL